MRGRQRPDAALVAIVGVRVALGATLVLAPRQVLVGVGEAPSSPARVFARVLGARHPAQAALTVAAGGSEVTAALGVAVDAGHAATMLPWAVLDARHRRSALTNAAVAGLFVPGRTSAVRRPR